MRQEEAPTSNVVDVKWGEEFTYRVKYIKRDTEKTKYGEVKNINDVLNKFSDCDILELDVKEIKMEEKSVRTKPLP